MNEKELAKERRMNIERSKMHVLEPREWPKGAESDGKLYSLECSRVADLVMVDGKLVELEAEAHDNFSTEKPVLTPVEGSYAEVSHYAAKMNKVQGQLGRVDWIYAPVLIKPELAAA